MPRIIAALPALVLVLLISRLSTSSCYIVDEHDVLHIPVQTSSMEGSRLATNFSFWVFEQHLEQLLTAFCEQKSLRYHICLQFGKIVLNIQHSEQLKRERESGSSSSRCSRRSRHRNRHNDDDDQQLLQYRAALQLFSNDINDDGCWHVLTRQLPNNDKSVSDINGIEGQVFGILSDLIDEMLKSQIEEFVRICVIHSADFDVEQVGLHENGRELDIILSVLHDQGLIDALDLIIVMHYGHFMPTINNMYHKSNVHFIHVSRDLSFGEIPTLRVFHNLASKFNLLNHNDPVHMLYLSTVGSRYQGIHLPIDNWLSMILYFLVENHWSCYHILESRKVDLIAVNFETTPRSLVGNSYWITSTYLAQIDNLPYISKPSSQIISSWLFKALVTRIHNPHNSRVNHEFSIYPRYCYSSVELHERPTFDEYLKYCTKDSIEEYSLLHDPEKLKTLSHYSQRSHFQIVDNHLVTSFCSILELGIVQD